MRGDSPGKRLGSTQGLGLPNEALVKARVVPVVARSNWQKVWTDTLSSHHLHLDLRMDLAWEEAGSQETDATT